MIEALQKGDEVITAGGVLGRISKMGEAVRHHRDRAQHRDHACRRPRCRCVLPKGTLKSIQ